jgi:hypothetical protein
MLGLLGLGAAAGPSVAQEAFNSISIGSQGNTIVPTAYLDKETALACWSPAEQLAEARKEYEMLMDTDKWIADYIAREWEDHTAGYNPIRIADIDSDIRNMKSFSESSKIRMHIKRKALRRLRTGRESIVTRIQRLMKDV